MTIKYVLQLLFDEEDFSYSIWIEYINSSESMNITIPIWESVYDFISNFNLTNKIIDDISAWLLTDSCANNYHKILAKVEHIERIYGNRILRYTHLSLLSNRSLFDEN